MEKKKFQVFISSTYLDLKDERKAVEQVIIRSGDIPVGMEAFPAADEEQFEFIKTIIDSCDYYVLIIAGMYGSVDNAGISYTEKEYRYAVSCGIPVLVLVHGERGSLNPLYCEKDPEKQERLESFIKSTTVNRLRDTWTTTDGLKLAVREALDHAKATKPRPGWVRGDRLASSELIEKLSNLQAENFELKKQIAANVPPQESLVSDEDLCAKTILKISYRSRAKTRSGEIRENSISVNTTFKEVFDRLSPSMIDSLNSSNLNNYIAQGFGPPKEEKYYRNESYNLDRECMEKLRVQFEALGLIEVIRATTVSGGVGIFWQLTKRGKKMMFASNVTRLDDAED